MGATKIINVLKDDSFEEIFDLFQNTTAEDVIFVLPKKSKLFSQDSHFPIFAREAQKLNKTVSVLCSNPDINSLAEQHGFILMGASGKTKKAAAEAARVNFHPIPPQDSAIHDDDTDAYDRNSRVAIPSDEVVSDHGEEDEDEEDIEKQAGMHVVEEEALKEELGGEGEEHYHEKDEEEPDEEELKDIEEIADVAVAPEEPDFTIVTAAKIDRGLDSVVTPEGTRTKLKIPKTSEKPVGLDVRTLEKSRDETIESVWRDEPIPEKGLWIKGLNKKSSKSAPSRLSKKLVAGLLVVSLLVLGAIVYVSTGSAKITLIPIEKKVDTSLKVEASDTFADVDPVFNKIPGQVFSVEKTVSDEFKATGEKEVAQKARGKLTVYNNYSSSPQTLIATTRFESEGGLIFRTLTTITVPGMRVDNGTVTPGKTDVEAIADKPGPEYNISAGKFRIVAFKERGDADRYEKYYGQSSVPMAGGASGLSKVVTEADFNAAKEAVTAKLKAEILENLRSQANGLEIADGSSIKIKSVTSTAQAEQAAEKFTITAEGELKTVGFKKEHLDELVVKFVDKTEDMTALTEKLDISFNSAVFAEDSSALSINVLISGPVYAKIDPDKIIADLLGKTEKDFREYLKTAPGVASAKVLLWPFWVKKMPKDKAKVRLEIAY